MIRVSRLVWDVANIGHIARHQVSPDEVEQVCHGDPVVRVAYAGRIMLIGPTDAGRPLAVVLLPEADEGVYRTVTARPASRKERALYSIERGGSLP